MPLSAEDVVRWFSIAKVSVSSDAVRVTEFHRAAAVLSTFNPVELYTSEGGPPTGDVLRALLRDSIHVETKEDNRWSLKTQSRCSALESVPSLKNLQLLLKLNERDPHDVLQSMLDMYILRTCIIAPELQSEEQLASSVQVVTWLSATPFANELKLPDSSSIVSRLQHLRQMRPLQEMIGAHFRGRDRELQIIDEFLSSATEDKKGPKPMLIHGYGGCGKTSLVAKALFRQAERKQPFVFLDFDRQVLIPEKPITLLLEASKQVQAQRANADANLESYIRLLDSLISTESTHGSLETFGSLLEGSVDQGIVTVFTKLFEIAEWRDKPLLFVLDTFEEVQYQSQKTVENLWAFMEQLRASMPAVRLLITGRAPVLIRRESSPFSKIIALNELDAKSSVECLATYDVPEETARFIWEHIGGNPLALRIAGELTKTETSQGMRNFVSESFANRLDDSLTQAILLRRFLGHVKDPDVRKLAHPGLALRRITPELIKLVLAKPCDIIVPNDTRAQELWEELARETALVMQDGSFALRHRPEVRRQMLSLLQNHRPEQVQAIHLAAVEYYRAASDDAGKAELLYHLLFLGRPPKELDRVWAPQLEPYLVSSREELPQDALIYLASRSEQTGLEAIAVTENEWSAQELLSWERKTAQWTRELLTQGRYREAAEALRVRSARSKGSPLFALHANVLISLNELDYALAVIEHGLLSAPSVDQSDFVLELKLLRSEILMRLGNHRDALNSCRDTVKELNASTSEEKRLQTAILVASTLGYEAVPPAIGTTLAGLLEGWPESKLRMIPAVARKAAAETLERDRQQASRVITAVGLGRFSRDNVADLAYALAVWNTQFMLSRGVLYTDTPAFKAGLTQRPSPTYKDWNSWIQSRHNDDLGVRLGLVIKELEPPANVVEILKNILRGWETVEDRTSMKSAVFNVALDERQQIFELVELLAERFRSRQLLNDFLIKHMDIELAYLVSSSSTMKECLHALIDSLKARNQLSDFLQCLANNSRGERQRNSYSRFYQFFSQVRK